MRRKVTELVDPACFDRWGEHVIRNDIVDTRLLGLVVGVTRRLGRPALAYC